jgi:hypothetical protein
MSVIFLTDDINYASLLLDLCIKTMGLPSALKSET